MAVDDDYYIKNDGRIYVQKTEDKFDRFFIESNEQSNSFDLLGQYVKNDIGLIAFPNQISNSNFTATYTGSNSERFISGASLARMIGVWNSTGYHDFSVNHWSLDDGASPKPSKSHKTGRNGDLRLLRLDQTGKGVTVNDKQFDKTRSQVYVDNLKKYGWGEILSRENKDGFLLNGVKDFDDKHLNHLHVQSGKAPTVIHGVPQNWIINLSQEIKIPNFKSVPNDIFGW